VRAQHVDLHGLQVRGVSTTAADDRAAPRTSSSSMALRLAASAATSSRGDGCVPLGAAAV
jgi:hypothetical protein